jgi:predicted metalloprotease
MAVGGGGVGLVIIVVALIMGVDPGSLLDMAQQPAADTNTTTSSGVPSDLSTSCQTGADANAKHECAIVGYVNSIQSFWSDEFAANGSEYTPAQTILYSGSTDAACGYASSAMGPFYCPEDQYVYLDLTFFNDLQTQYGAEGGPFAEAYVLAHEYGHHVQDLLGALNSSGSSPEESVAIELQADCLAGIWMYHAVETGFIAQMTDQDIEQSLNAAAAIGDDRIQQQSQGYVSPETWTHGSSSQRQAAIKDGLRSGDVQTCDTPGT